MGIALVVAAVVAQFIVLLATSEAVANPQTPRGAVIAVFVCAVAAPVLAYIAGKLPDGGV